MPSSIFCQVGHNFCEPPACSPKRPFPNRVEKFCQQRQLMFAWFAVHGIRHGELARCGHRGRRPSARGGRGIEYYQRGLNRRQVRSRNHRPIRWFLPSQSCAGPAISEIGCTSAAARIKHEATAGEPKDVQKIANDGEPHPGVQNKITNVRLIRLMEGRNVIKLI